MQIYPHKKIFASTIITLEINLKRKIQIYIPRLFKTIFLKLFTETKFNNTNDCLQNNTVIEKLITDKNKNKTKQKIYKQT